MQMKKLLGDGSESRGSDLASALRQLRETKYLLDSMRAGNADALVLEIPEGEQVFTLQSLHVLMDFIIEHSVGATVILDNDGVVLRASPSVEALFLVNPIGHHFDGIFPLTAIDSGEPENGFANSSADSSAESSIADPRIHGRLLIKEVLSGSVLNGLEAALTCKDGTLLSLLIAAKPLRPFGAWFKGAVVTILDVTPRKKAEVQLLVRNQQLRYQFELTKSITDSTSEALFLTDLDGFIHFLNPAAEKMFGWTFENLIGRALHEVMHPQHGSDLASLGSCGLGRLTDSLLAEVSEDSFLRADGKIVSVRYSRSPVITKGKVTGTVYGVRDISEWKLAEEALHLSEEKLRQSQKMEAIGRLAGGIAHDFNNLLTAINGYAALGMEELSPDEMVHGYLEEIGKAGARAASLTSQLLSYSRKQILASRVIDLNAIVTDTVSIVQRTLGENIMFQVDLSPGPCLVNVDPIRIQQVIVNLAINSRDAMPNGGNLRMETKPVTVVEAEEGLSPGEAEEGLSPGEAEEGLSPGDYIQFSVIDDGQGMDDNVKAHLFEPFFTTKEVGKGTGLGLSMAYGIVKQHRGRIQVFSEVGKGATFHILFPATLCEKHPEPVKPVIENLAPGNETILLVEDEAVVLNLMRRVLADSGYKVLEARNGVEALEVSDNYPGPVDILITDVLMSRMGGHELGEALKIRRPGMPQIFISGYNEDLILRREIRDEASLFLQKPFSPVTLTRLVRKTLDHKRVNPG